MRQPLLPSLKRLRAGASVDGAADYIPIVDSSETGADRNKRIYVDELLGIVGGLLGTAAGLDVDTDGTLAANSDALIATQKAVKTYVAAAVAGLLDLKGSTDCSADPNYAAHPCGHTPNPCTPVRCERPEPDRACLHVRCPANRCLRQP